MKIRKRKVVCRDLRNNSIDVSALIDIVTDVQYYHIYGLKFRMLRYVLIEQRLRRGVGIRQSAVEITFDKRNHNNDRTTKLHGIINLFHAGKYYKICMELEAEAMYEYEPYDLKIQDYLYTYFSNVIETDERLETMFGRMELPDQLSNYIPGDEWDNGEVKQFHWVEFKEEDSILVEARPFTVQCILGVRETKLRPIRRQYNESRLFENATFFK